MWVGDCGGASSTALTAVMAEQEVAVGAAPTLVDLEEGRSAIFHELCASGICAHGAAAFARRSLNWF